jgi:Ca-activated chloride channel family protein
MSLHVAPLEETTPDAEGGLGALVTDRGNLPLDEITAKVAITGLLGTVELTQGFRNPFDVPLEATYIFPLPDRAAVTAMRMTADGRVVDAELKERGQARAEYDQAIAEGKRASIAEEERPDVFTIRVGNILPGERVMVALTLVGPLSYEDGEAMFRLPLVVAPRYIPGEPLGGADVGAGYHPDTDAVPDASRITPPVLLPGFPNPVRLAIGVDIDPAGLPLGQVRSSLHTVVGEGNHLSIQPGERANRDFVLRLAYGEPDRPTHALTVSRDNDGDEGTFRLTVLPPTTAAPPRPRDVVLVLDRSGSMQGWKMVAARRAAARIVDTLTATDRFAALAFDDRVETASDLGERLQNATDRNRFRAVEHLARVDARGGTEMLEPLRRALALLKDPERDRVLVLVTDGQVGNEDQILGALGPMKGVRVHTVGIDEAVNAGFLGRLAAAGGGRVELVHSESRLDEAMDNIHRRIGAPVVAGLSLDAPGAIADAVSPRRLPDLFPGAPVVVTGRYRDRLEGVQVKGRTRDGQEWTADVPTTATQDPALPKVWARAHLIDLIDAYASDPYNANTELEQRITAVSLRFGVLCRFTAWVAIDTRVVAAGEEVHHVIQPVEPVRGWDMAAPVSLMSASMTMAGAAPAPSMRQAMMPAPMAAGPGVLGRARSMKPSPYRGVDRAAEKKAKQEADKRAKEQAETALAEFKAALAVEAGRLHEAEGAPAYERRELLADLGTRLQVLLDELDRQSPEASVDRVRQLALRCAGDRPLTLADDEFERLWADARTALGDPVADRSRSFWKR